jgi:hypothetical protein
MKASAATAGLPSYTQEFPIPALDQFPAIADKLQAACDASDHVVLLSLAPTSQGLLTGAIMTYRSDLDAGGADAAACDLIDGTGATSVGASFAALDTAAAQLATDMTSVKPLTDALKVASPWALLVGAAVIVVGLAYITASWKS